MRSGVVVGRREGVACYPVVAEFCGCDIYCHGILFKHIHPTCSGRDIQLCKNFQITIPCVIMENMHSFSPAQQCGPCLISSIDTIKLHPKFNTPVPGSSFYQRALMIGAERGL